MLELFKYTDSEQKELLNSIVILVDTREKDGKNDHILQYFDKNGITWKRKKLPQGDYSFMIPQNEKLNILRDLYFDKQIIIERKNSIEELSSTLTESRDRFKKELSLAPKNKILLIENGSYESVVSGNYNTQYDKRAFTASLHSFWHEFNLPIVFMPDRNFTGLFIYGHFRYYLRNIIK